MLKGLLTIAVVSAALLNTARAQGGPAAADPASTRLVLDQAVAEIRQLTMLLLESIKELTLERLSSEERQLSQKVDACKDDIDRFEASLGELPEDDYVARDHAARGIAQARSSLTSMQDDLARLSADVARVRGELNALRETRTRKGRL